MFLGPHVTLEKNEAKSFECVMKFIVLLVSLSLSLSLYIYIYIYEYIYIYIYLYIYIYIDRNEEEIYWKNWWSVISENGKKKRLNPDSNRDPPAHAADCSTVELLRPRPDSRARGHLNHFFNIFLPHFNLYMNGKISEGQVYVPRLEPTAPIRLADRNHAHYPSCHRTIFK